MDVFQYPKTWSVGDKLNADNLNTWVRDQNKILLRRPLTVANSTVNQTIPTSGHGNYVVTFDNIIQDDDGMVLEDTPVTDFYAQRAGTYQVWASLDFVSLSVQNTVMMTLAINGTNLLYRQQHTCAAATGLDVGMCVGGTFFMGVGEYLELQAWNSSGSSTQTLKSLNQSPRLCIMWLGPS